MFSEWIEGLTNLRVFDELIAKAESGTAHESIFARIRDEIGIRTDIDPAALESIPRTGPLIVAANHPTGFAEGLAVPAMLDTIRSDVFVLGHSFFERWPALADRMVLVDPQTRSRPVAHNAGAIVRAARRLRKGACMLMFPAGEVARPTSPDLKAKEGTWKIGLAKLVRLSGAPIQTLHVSGSTSLLYRTASWLHPRLGVPLLFREAMNTRKRPMRIDVGPFIAAGEFNRFGSDRDAVNRVRDSLVVRYEK